MNNFRMMIGDPTSKNRWFLDGLQLALQELWSEGVLDNNKIKIRGTVKVSAFTVQDEGLCILFEGKTISILIETGDPPIARGVVSQGETLLDKESAVMLADRIRQILEPIMADARSRLAEKRRIKSESDTKRQQMDSERVRKQVADWLSR